MLSRQRQWSISGWIHDAMYTFKMIRATLDLHDVTKDLKKLEKRKRWLSEGSRLS